jgi:hypothetical protein
MTLPEPVEPVATGFPLWIQNVNGILQAYTQLSKLWNI